MSIFHWFEMQTQNGSWYISWYSSWYSNWYSNWYSHLIKPPDTKQNRSHPKVLRHLQPLPLNLRVWSFKVWSIMVVVPASLSTGVVVVLAWLSDSGLDSGPMMVMVLMRWWWPHYAFHFFSHSYHVCTSVRSWLIYAKCDSRDRWVLFWELRGSCQGSWSSYLKPAH